MSDPQFADYLKLLEIAQANQSSTAMRKAIIAAGLSFNEDEPLSGYYRHAEHKGGPLEPVAIWRDGDVLNIYWGKDEARLDRVWPFCAWKPVPFAWYKAKMDGAEWPDVHQRVEDEEPPLDGIEEMAGRLPGPGHNSGATVDELMALAEQISEARAGEKQYTIITSDEHRAQSQTLRSTLLELSGTALKRRTALSRPHLDALEEIRAKWTPLVDGPKDGADKIKRAQEAWGTLKMRRQQEEDRRIEAERRKAEEEAQARADEAQAAVDAGLPPPDPVPQTPIPEPQRVAPQTSFKGGSGRAASEKKINVITEVFDWQALFAYFSEDRDAQAYILKRAQTILKNTGETPPGCQVDVAAKVA